MIEDINILPASIPGSITNQVNDTREGLKYFSRYGDDDQLAYLDEIASTIGYFEFGGVRYDVWINDTGPDGPMVYRVGFKPYSLTF